MNAVQENQSVWQRWAWTPLPLFVIGLAGLHAAGTRAAYESPFLLTTLNLIFSTFVALFVAYLCGRSFQAKAESSLVLLGCGVLIGGVSCGVAAGAIRYSANHTVTIHNLGVWLSGLCSLSAAVLASKGQQPRRLPELWLASVYSAGLAVVALVVVATYEGWLPVFFVQGQGGTPIRQMVLGSATGMFALTATLLWLLYLRKPTAFSFWYAQGLALLAVGLAGVLTEPVLGGLISWTGRAAQYLGGVYLLVAGLAAVREANGWTLSLAESLQESRDRLAAFAASTFEGIVESENGRIIDCNEQFAQMTGRRVAELKNMSMQELTAPEDRERVAANLIRNCESVTVHAMLRNDGTRLIVEAHGRPVASGGARRYTAIRDITALKRTEEAKFSALFHGSSDGILLVDPITLTCALGNETVCRMLGYAAEELKSLRLDDLQSPADLGQGLRVFSDLTGEERVSLPDISLVRKDGSAFYAHVTTAHLTISGVRYIAYFLRDITERKQAEMALQASEERHRSILHAAMDGFSRTDMQGRLLEVNDAFCRMSGYSEQELLTMNIADLEASETPAEIAVRMRKLMADQSVCFETSHRRKDGSVFLAEINAQYKPAEGGYTAAFIRDITERKRTEKALAEEAVRRRILVEQSSDGIVVLDEDGSVYEANQRYSDMLGYSPEETRSLHIWDWDLQWTREQLMEMIRRVGNQGEHFETRHRRKDGTFIDVEISTNGAVLGGQKLIFCVCRDISHRKQAERELAKEHSLLESLITSSPDVIFFKDRSSRFLRINETQAKRFGLSNPHEAVGKSDADFFKRTYAQKTLSEEQRVMATGQPMISTEEQELWQDGHITWASSTKVALRDEQGEIIGLIGISRDITEHKRAEAELQRLAQAVEQAAEIIVITDFEGIIRYVNPAFEALTGYSRQEAIGQNPRLLKSGRQDDLFYAQMWETLGRGEAWHGRFTNKRKDGTLFVEDAVISPIRNTSGAITNYVATKRDVTREQHLEQQILQSHKMEAVGRLAGGVAHDFNNLLQAILGYCELLLPQVEQADSLRDDVLEIQNSAKRAADLTGQLLSFSRRQMTSLAVLNLNDVVERTRKMLRRIIGEDVHIALDLADELPPIKADGGQIEQVIMNLAVNARDAMPNGGHLSLSTKSVTLDEDMADILPDSRPGSFVCLTVTDTGTGMSADVLGHIFEPFFTTKVMGKGTGLGLSVIYGIARQNQGWVNVFSKVGQGTTFMVYFPVADGSEARVQLASAPQAPPRGRGERVLLVEDEPSVRNLAIRVLNAAGYSVYAAGNSTEGRDLFARESGRFDVLFSDVVLPDYSGFATAEYLLQQKPNLKVLLCSGYTDERACLSEIKQQRFRFLQKPYSKADLLQTLRDILDAKPAPSA